jgi:hypothetical protein
MKQHGSLNINIKFEGSKDGSLNEKMDHHQSEMGSNNPPSIHMDAA